VCGADGVCGAAGAKVSIDFPLNVIFSSFFSNPSV